MQLIQLYNTVNTYKTITYNFRMYEKTKTIRTLDHSDVDLSKRGILSGCVRVYYIIAAYFGFSNILRMISLCVMLVSTLL